VEAFSRDNQEGRVVVRDDWSAQDGAVCIATTYHVRTQPLSYLYGCSTYAVLQDPKFLCDKAVTEVHYASSLKAR
jgi:hypothetical protein